ncbi:MAG: sphingomyelin phosphodiesterase [Bdellovibrio sp.]|nr:sphingomyelin phosphodiesterase [Bdellovibrio sp.]
MESKIKTWTFYYCSTLLAFIFCVNVFAYDTGPTGDFRLITYNVKGLPVPFRLKHKELPLIAKSIRSFSADVICFQETFTKRAHVLKEMPEYRYVVEGPHKKGKVINSGLIIASKYPITRIATHVYKKCTGADCFASKGIVVATIKHPTLGEIDIFNTHMNAGKNKKVKWSQWGQLLQFVKSHISPDRPAIFAGDFNTDRGSQYLDYIYSEGTLKDTHLDYVAHHPELSEKEKLGNTFPGRKIDYVFTLGETETDTQLSKILYDGSHDNNLFSDHYALMVDLNFKN